MLQKSQNNQKKQTGNKNFKNPKMKTSAEHLLTRKTIANFKLCTFKASVLRWLH